MKKKGCNCDYTRERYENLRREFEKRMREGAPSKHSVFRRLALETPADRFYISEEGAYRDIVRLGTPLENRRCTPQRRRMLFEIRRRAAGLMEEDASLSLRDAVYRVVNSPAPAFYLTPGSVKIIFYTACMKIGKNNGKNYA